MIATAFRISSLRASASIASRTPPLMRRTFMASAARREDGGKGGGDSIPKVTADTFDKEVTQSTQPVLVDFTATWCMPCRMLGPVLDKAVKKDGRVKLVKIDVDEQATLAGDYGIASLPTVVAFHKGSPVDSFIGVRNAPAVGEFIDDVIAKISSSKDPK
ncbi:hypothetical protein GGI23_007928 [Coemansia sp. RSA 2559]|nr:hypothetical protein GGI23_007928 [Coemansia sp. RSA 2559]KAJ2861839.1 hypothetical protein GGI22_002347 [Coemansia erecta]